LRKSGFDATAIHRDVQKTKRRPGRVRKTGSGD
jgi:hypothetical protein